MAPDKILSHPQVAAAALPPLAQQHIVALSTHWTQELNKVAEVTRNKEVDTMRWVITECRRNNVLEPPPL